MFTLCFAFSDSMSIIYSQESFLHKYQHGYQNKSHLNPNHLNMHKNTVNMSSHQ